MNQSRRTSLTARARSAGASDTAGLIRPAAGRRPGRQHDAPRRQVVHPADAIDMGPEAEDQHQRHADVDEDQHGEETVVDRVGGEEVARRDSAEDRQPVEQFGRGHRGKLRQAVPDDPVAADAGDEHQPDQRHAGDPGVEAEAVVAAVGPFAQQVQDHHHDEGVGGVAVQAAQHAAEIPLLLRQPADRAVDTLDAGVEHRVEVEAAGDQDPEEEQAQRAEVAQRIVGAAEERIEKVFAAFEDGQARCRAGLHASSRWGVRNAGMWPTIRN
jgi:hypothetical protein